MKARKLLCLMAIFLSLVLYGCSNASSALQDGYYTAELSDFDEHGWKEFVLIRVSEGKIIMVEYDAFNRSGFAKSWDLDYMRVMKLSDGTYPNEFSRMYAVSLINWQDSENIDAVSGATHSYNTFRKLADAVIANAKAGDKQVALVD